MPVDTAPTETTSSDAGFLTPVEETYVPSIDDDPAPVEETAAGDETPTEEAEEPAEGADADETPAPKATRDSLMERYAKEHGLNLNDKRERIIAQRMADKELHIVRLKGDGKPADPEAPDESNLTEFERKLIEEEATAAKAETPAKSGDEKKGEAKVEPTRYGDMLDGKNVKESYEALNEAWKEYGEGGTIDKVRAVEDAIFIRRFDAIVSTPHFQRMMDQRVEQMLDQRIAPLQKEHEENRETQIMRRAQDTAMKELNTLPQYKGLGAELYAVDPKSPTMDFNGEKLPNTAMNRIIAENPAILNIHVDHADPEKAYTLTYLARYKVAASLHRAGKTSPAAAKQIMNAGATRAQREQQDKARTGINAGRGASQTGSNGKTGSYMHDLIANDNGPEPL